MKIDVARQNLSLTALLFALLGVFFLFRGVVWPSAVEEGLPADVLLGGYLTALLGVLPLLGPGFYLFLLGYCAFRVARIVTRNMVYVTRNFLPIVFYVVLAAGVFVTPWNLNGMVVALLFAGASRYFVASFRRSYCFSEVFRAGIALGLMPLFYPPSVAMWLCLPLALILFKRSVRETVVCLMGLLLPLLVYGYLSWAVADDFCYPVQQVLGYLFSDGGNAFAGMEPGQMVLAGLLGMLVLLSALTYAGMGRSMRTRPSRVCLYFIVALVVAGGTFFIPGGNVMSFPLLAVGGAVIAPLFFVRNAGIFSAVFYVLILVCAVVANLLMII